MLVYFFLLLLQLRVTDRCDKTKQNTQHTYKYIKKGKIEYFTSHDQIQLSV